MVDVPTLIFVFQTKIAPLKALCRNGYCHDAKSTSLVFLDECTAIKILHLKQDAWLTVRFEGTNS
jgi:hypothetical protein